MPVRPIALVSAAAASGIAVSGAALVVADTPAVQRVAAPASPLFAEPIVSSPDPACSQPPATPGRPPAPSGWAPDRMRAAFWGIGGPIAGVGFVAADAAAPSAGVVTQCRTLRLRYALANSLLLPDAGMVARLDYHLARRHGWVSARIAARAAGGPASVETPGGLMADGELDLPVGAAAIRERGALVLDVTLDLTSRAGGRAVFSLDSITLEPR